MYVRLASSAFERFSPSFAHALAVLFFLLYFLQLRSFFAAFARFDFYLPLAGRKTSFACLLASFVVFLAIVSACCTATTNRATCQSAAVTAAAHIRGTQRLQQHSSRIVVVCNSRVTACIVVLSSIAIMLCCLSRSCYPHNKSPVCARGRCRISPPRFLAECCKKQLNQGSHVLLYFRLLTFSDWY